MLTLILLVVLGGGVALVAVSLAESPKPATDAGPARREPDEPAVAPDPPDPDQTDAVAAGAPAADLLAAVPLPGAPPSVRDPHQPPLTSVRAEQGGHVPASTTVAVDPGPPRRRSRGDVPKAYTAIEGRYGDVARAPWWRRLVSLALIVAIAVVCGVAIAGVLGAVIAAVAEVVGNTIG